MKEIEFNSNDWDLVVDSPGRINIIGEHTDYNNGFVLPTAIDKKIQFKFKKNGSAQTCSIYSNNVKTGFTFDLRTVEPSEQQWQNYVLGVVYEIQQLGKELQGFDCVLTSDIPIGSGVSSSAALECGLAFGLNELFDLKLTKQTIVALSQRAEHHFVGTKCGIMDQFASVMSKKDHVILLDCASLDFKYVPVAIEPYKILLLNTNVSHNLASGEYNIRRSQCEEGVALIQQQYPEVKSLRDATPEMLETCKANMDPVVYKRCSYIVHEIQRVLVSVEALEKNELHVLGEMMYATHDGLQKDYEVSCEELDFLVNYAKNKEEVIGSRMMGGGFGGCTINLVHKDGLANFIENASKAYYDKFQINLTAFEANPSSGTSIIA